MEEALKEMVRLGLLKVRIDKNGEMSFKPTEEGGKLMDDMTLEDENKSLRAICKNLMKKQFPKDFEEDGD